jgi:hypothetical protein
MFLLLHYDDAVLKMPFMLFVDALFVYVELSLRPVVPSVEQCSVAAAVAAIVIGVCVSVLLSLLLLATTLHLRIVNMHQQ